MKKIADKVPVPSELKGFFYDVLTELNSSTLAAKLPSDDLLQCDFAYGGLCEVNGEQFLGFTYFAAPRNDNDRFPKRWFILLPRSKLELIVSGRLAAIDMWRCEPDCGNRFAFENDICSYCDY